MITLRSVVRYCASVALIVCTVVVVNVAAQVGGMLRFVCALIVVAVAVSVLSKEL